MSIIDDAGVGVKRQKGQEFECEDELFQGEYPGIFEWLSRILLKGKAREGASLTIKYKDGGVSLCLSAPQEGLVGWHQGKTYHEALEALEQRLQAGKMDWRERKDSSPRRY